MYDLHDYDTMLADPVRTRGYLDAIAYTVRPGDVVLEIGTGVGYFAVAAARLGARRVYAIELSDVADVAREVVAENGCAGVVEVIRGDSAAISLPERCNVLLEDLRGVLPTLGHRFAVLADARERHLMADARFVAQRDTIWAAPCVAPADDIGADALGDVVFDIDRRAVARRLRDSWRRVRLVESEQLAEARQLATIDLAAVSAPNVEGTAEWTIARDGRLDGIAVWFDAELAGGSRIPNAPAAPRALYGQAFFPLSAALDVHAGDSLRFEWRALLVADDYVFAWNTRHEPANGSHVVAYRQSTLATMLPPSDVLMRSDALGGSTA